MTKLTIIRTECGTPSKQVLDAAHQLIFQFIDGFTESDKKGWRRLWSKIMRLEPGELLQVEAVIPRNPKYHRKFFALLQVGFDAWDAGRKRKTYKGREVTKNFERFREDVTILAGYYEQTFDLRGKMRLQAKSISFAKMEDAEFEQLYSSVVDVLLVHVLTKYANREELDAVVERVMGFC